MIPSYKEKIYNFEVPKLDASALIAAAITSYEQYEQKKVNLETIPEDKINHILLNFIRHRTIENYNRVTRSPSFEQDHTEYFYWFKAVNNEIGKKYPFLRKVIGQQISRKRRAIFTEEASK